MCIFVPVLGVIFLEFCIGESLERDTLQTAMDAQREASGQPTAEAPPAEKASTRMVASARSCLSPRTHLRRLRDWTNDALKKLASSGSWYFDLVFYQVTALSKCQTTKKHAPAPNDQFVMFYDAMVDRLLAITPP